MITIRVTEFTLLQECPLYVFTAVLEEAVLIFDGKTEILVSLFGFAGNVGGHRFLICVGLIGNVELAIKTVSFLPLFQAFLYRKYFVPPCLRLFDSCVHL